MDREDELELLEDLRSVLEDALDLAHDLLKGGENLYVNDRRGDVYNTVDDELRDLLDKLRGVSF